MALVSCRECKNEVSDTALQCMKCGVRLRAPQIGFLGNLFEYLFILLNMIMAYYFISYTFNMGIDINSAATEDIKIRLFNETVRGVEILLKFWACGSIILGTLIVFVRKQK